MSVKKITIFSLVTVLVLLISFVSVTGYNSYVHAHQVAEEKREEEEKVEEADRARRAQIQAEQVAVVEAEKAKKQEIKSRLQSGDFTGTNYKIVFLTFDDGPDDCSNEILDTLKANDVKATFFTNGRTDENAVNIYKRIVNEGHILGNHSWSHNYSLYKNPDSFFADVEKLANWQKEVTGVEPIKVMRFPGGSNNANQACRDGIKARGYNYYDWNVDCEDGLKDTITPQQAYDSIINQVHKFSVSVVLLHAERPPKAGGRQALDQIIKTLKSEGYTFMTIDPSYNLAKFI